MNEPTWDYSRLWVESLGTTVARLGRCYVVLADVVIFAGEAPDLSDEQLRARLVRLADQAACVLGGGNGR